MAQGEISENHLLPLMVGAATVTGLSLAYLGWLGALGAFVDQVLTYNLQRVLLGYGHSANGLRAPTIRLDRIIREAAAALFVMAAIGALGVVVKPERPAQRMSLWWTAASMVSIAGFREFEQIVPCFSILAAGGVGRRHPELRKKPASCAWSCQAPQTPRSARS